MYFKQFPKIAYLFEIGNTAQLRVVRDIVLNVRFKEKVLNNIALFDDYVIADQTTPELISEHLYGTPMYHWIIMLVNDKFDHIKDFPISELALTNYAFRKYKDEITDFYPQFAESTEDFTYRKYKQTDDEDYDTVLNRYVLVDDFPVFANSEGEYVESDDPDAHQVTNIEYETIEHEVRYGDSVLTEEQYVLRSPKILYGEELYRGNFDGIACDKDTPWSTRITNLEFEQVENESLRTIRVINNQIITQVAEEMYGIFENFNGTS